jgi:hypothetical protein
VADKEDVDKGKDSSLPKRAGIEYQYHSNVLDQTIRKGYLLRCLAGATISRWVRLSGRRIVYEPWESESYGDFPRLRLLTGG